jgi:hypothetical protein
MRSYFEKLLKWFKALLQKLTRSRSQKLKREPLNKKTVEAELEEPLNEFFSSVEKLELPDEQVSQQQPLLTEIDTSQNLLNYPPMPAPELLIDRPFGDKSKRDLTGFFPPSAQGKNIGDHITSKPLPSRNEIQPFDKFNRKRPYIKYYTDELERLARAEWNNLKILNGIHHELQFRSRKKAQTLLIRIVERLTELKSEKPFSWPPITAEPADGMLKLCGYKVGLNGLPENQRRQILDNVFLHFLPSIDDVSYLGEWGQPGTAKRLRKLAESIAAFTRNAKRRNSGNFNKAIQNWEADLAYLKRTYYEEQFNFHWPRTALQDRE